MLDKFKTYFKGSILGNGHQQHHVQGSKSSGVTFFGHSEQGAVKLDLTQDAQGDDIVTLSIESEARPLQQVYSSAITRNGNDFKKRQTTY